MAKKNKDSNVTANLNVEVAQNTKDDLLTDLAEVLNKSNKDGGKIAYFLDDQDDPSTITDWISTGNSLLDLAISNRPHGGLPVGRMVELNGLEGCVTEDTKIKVIMNEMAEIKEITIGEVLNLMFEGKKVKVLTKNDTFSEITDFVDKGLLDTYKVSLENGNSIKVSKEHKFFTNLGWLETKDIIPSQTKIYCEDKKYHQITSIEYIGKERIVDITIKDDEHCYFGNGMLNHNTGKSLIAAHICAETQRKGGKAIVIDTENSAAPEFWKSLGVNLSSLLYIQRETVEEIFEVMESAIAYIRKNNADALVTIIVDSVAGATTKAEQESEHGKDGYSTGKSIIISKAMRKITGMIGRQKVLIVYTNQLRMNLNAMAFGDKWIVSGGKALAYHCSVRVRLNTIGKLKKDEVVIGNKCKAVVVKNRMGPPNRSAEFDIYYDSGIADYASWLKILKDNKIINQGGAYYSYKDKKFQSNDFVKMMVEDSSLKEELYQKICDAVIMKYKEPNSLIREDVEVDVNNDE